MCTINEIKLNKENVWAYKVVVVGENPLFPKVVNSLFQRKFEWRPGFNYANSGKDIKGPAHGSRLFDTKVFHCIAAKRTAMAMVKDSLGCIPSGSKMAVIRVLLSGQIYKGIHHNCSHVTDGRVSLCGTQAIWNGTFVCLKRKAKKSA